MDEVDTHSIGVWKEQLGHTRQGYNGLSLGKAEQKRNAKTKLRITRANKWLAWVKYGK